MKTYGRTSEKEQELIPLTPAQQRVYDFVKQQLAAGHGAPSRREVAAALGRNSASGINAHLKKIQAKGWLRIARNRAHGLELTTHADVPLLSADGTASLGRPLDPERDFVGRIPGELVERFNPRPDVFLELDRFGMNMQGLAPGEIVALNTKKAEPANGDIVILQLNGWFQCRVFRRIDKQLVELIDVDRDSGNLVNRVDERKQKLYIEGVVVGTLLAYRTLQLPWYREQLPELRGDSG